LSFLIYNIIVCNIYIFLLNKNVSKDLFIYLLSPYFKLKTGYIYAIGHLTTIIESKQAKYIYA